MEDDSDGNAEPQQRIDEKAHRNAGPIHEVVQGHPHDRHRSNLVRLAFTLAAGMDHHDFFQHIKREKPKGQEEGILLEVDFREDVEKANPQ